MPGEQRQAANRGQKRHKYAANFGKWIGLGSSCHAASIKAGGIGSKRDQMVIRFRLILLWHVLQLDQKVF